MSGKNEKAKLLSPAPLELPGSGHTSQEKRQMKIIQYIYGCGHVLNDLCAASWFTYMLVFFEFVSGRSATAAGGLVLVGQIVDALTTPLVGIFCDRSASKADPTVPGDTVAKRLPWHLGGSILVLVSYPFLFMESAQDTFGSGPYQIFAWYCIYVTLFQIGWATTQISHLSLIPDLSTGCSERRCSLNATRYAATVLATVAVYVVCLILLGTASNNSVTGPPTPAPTNHTELYGMEAGSEELAASLDLLHGSADSSESSLTVKNAPQFRWLAIFNTCTGFVFTFILFQVGMRLSTRKAGHLLINPDSPTANNSAKTKDILKMWMSCRKAKCVGAMYMSTRLVVNIAQTYLPYYLTRTLGMHDLSIALGPLILYIFSFLASIAIRDLDKRIGPEKSYALALAGILGACTMFYFIEHSQWLVYVACGIFGFFSSILMVSCLSLVAKLIRDLPGSAFVYGAFSFLDKMSSGAAIMLIQYFKGERGSCCDGTYYRYIVSFFPMVVAVFAIACVFGSSFLESPSTWEEYCERVAANKYDSSEEDEEEKASINAHPVSA